MRAAIALLAVFFPVAVQAGLCAGRSGPQTTALVELYTSEGCRSCPPADRWLSGLEERYGLQRVVPLALHVDYWDYIGWKDPYAKREFSLRQRKLTQLQRLAFVYTPQVMLQGRDYRWETADFDATLARINGAAGRAGIELEILAAAGKAFTVRAIAEVFDRSERNDAVLYMASYENRLQSQVTAGENRGRRLAHDHVVLQWDGPIAFSGGKVVAERVLPLLPGAVAAHSGAVAFVQNRRTAAVLQALALPACP